MKKNLIFTLFLFGLFTLSACYKTIDKMGNSANEVVLSYPAVNQFNLASSGMNFWKNALITPDLGKESDTLLFSLNIPRPLASKVTFHIGTDQEAVKAYNKDTLYGAGYSLMPEDYYSIVSSEINLPPGKTDTTFKVALHPLLIDISKTGYILPVSIASADGIRVSPTMHTAYIHIEKDPFPPFSRANWSVAGFDSQEETGEGPDNGRVKNLFDNNTNTFWHTEWQNAQPGPPHWFSIDMNAMHVLHGIEFLDRQGVGSPGRPKDVKVEVSKDNKTWSTADAFTLADDNGKWQKITFPNPTGEVQYFKVTITSVYGDTFYTNLSEIKVF